MKQLQGFSVHSLQKIYYQSIWYMSDKIESKPNLLENTAKTASLKILLCKLKRIINRAVEFCVKQKNNLLFGIVFSVSINLNNDDWMNKSFNYIIKRRKKSHYVYGTCSYSIYWQAHGWNLALLNCGSYACNLYSIYGFIARTRKNDVELNMEMPLLGVIESSEIL